MRGILQPAWLLPPLGVLQLNETCVFPTEPVSAADVESRSPRNCSFRIRYKAAPKDRLVPEASAREPQHPLMYYSINALSLSQYLQPLLSIAQAGMAVR